MLPVILVAVGAYLIGDSVLEDKKYARGGELDWANDENEQLGKWLLSTKSGKNIIAESKNSQELEKNVRDYTNDYDGIAGLSMDDEDEGLDWVTFDDLYNEIHSRKEQGGYMADGGELNVNDIINKFGNYINTDEAQKKWDNSTEEERLIACGYNSDYQNVKFKDLPIYVKSNVSQYYFLDKYGERTTNKSMFKADGGKMAKGGVMPKGARSGIKIKNWYVKNYPTDELGEDINDTITFKGYWAMTSQGYNPYKVLGVDDSVVRERVDGKLSEILGVDNYEYKKGGKLVGKQKNLDVNKNGKLDAEDFKMLRGKKMAKGGKLKINGDDFSFLLDLTDKELSKRLDLTRKQQDINGKQYLAAKEKNESTKKVEDSRKNLDNQERAIIEARARKMAK
jgi:hypothetical protein